MPNRILKASVCFSESINNLSDKAEIFFYRLMLQCDDFGVYIANPQLLKSTCFPLVEEGMTSKDVESWMGELEAQGMVFYYRNKGKAYIKITNWEDHQQIRSKHKKYPMPEDEGSERYFMNEDRKTECNNVISHDIICNQMQADDIILNPVISDDIKRNQVQANDSICHRNPIQSYSESNSYSESILLSDEKGNEPEPALLKAEETKEETMKPPSQKAIDKTFDSVWELYPRKEGKGKVTPKRKLVLFQIGEDHLKRAVGRYAKDKQGTEYQFLQMGSTFFNSGIVDYLDENYKAPPCADGKGKQATARGQMSGKVSGNVANFTGRAYDTAALKDKLVAKGRGEVSG